MKNADAGCFRPLPCDRFLFIPITYPTSALLDCMLGQYVGTVYSKDELKKLMYGEAQHTVPAESDSEPVTIDISK